MRGGEGERETAQRRTAFASVSLTYHCVSTQGKGHRGVQAVRRVPTLSLPGDGRDWTQRTYGRRAPRVLK